MLSQNNIELITEAVSQEDRDRILRYERLYKTADVYYTLPSEIDDKCLQEFLQLVHSNNDRIITLICSGYGGSALAALGIADLILSSKLKIFRGVILGEAHSAHSIIWSACHKREVGRFSFMGVHGCSSGSWGVVKDHHDHLKQVKYLDSNIAKIYALACKKKRYNFEYWQNVIKRTNLGTKLITAEDIVTKYKMGDYYEDDPQLV